MFINSPTRNNKQNSILILKLYNHLNSMKSKIFSILTSRLFTSLNKRIDTFCYVFGNEFKELWM